MANETKIDTLSIDIDYSAGTANTGLTNLTNTLEKLATVTAGSLSGLKSASTQLNRFTKVSQSLDSAKITSFATNISSISSAVKPLTELGKTNLGSFFNQLKKLPELNKSLDPTTIAQFTTKIKDLSNAMLPLANNMAKVTAGFSSLPSKLNKVSSYTAKASKSVSALSSISSLLNFGAIFASARMVGNYLSDFITSSNAYVENLNLFTVAMGESTEKAKEWIGTVTDALGIEPGGMMRYMGVFQMMASGFGMSADNAYKISKNLTQLTYDMASYFNMNIDEAAQKVQSAFAGELEPVRRLGYALDQATLKQIALNHGIEESFTNMSQAEKAQLRYIALLTQIPQVQGDMGRTIMSSANAIRVLKQQFVILGREIGNIFIPLLMKIVPTAIAVVKVLSKVAKAIASLLGFELPDLNWDSVSIGADIGDGVADSLDDASGSAKRLKRQLAGFDELNNLTSPTPSSGGGAGGGAGGADFELDLPEYDMLEGYTKGIKNLTQQMMDFFGLSEDSLGKLSWSWKEMDKNAKAFAITLGAILAIKGLVSLAKIIKSLSVVFGALKGDATGFFGIFTGSKAADSVGILSKISSGFSAIASALGLTVSSLLLVVAAIAAVIGTFVHAYKNDEKFKQSIDNLVNAFKSLWSTLNSSLKPLFEQLQPLIDMFVNNIKIGTSEIIKIGYEILKLGLKQIIDGITASLTIMNQLIQGDFSGAWETFLNLFTNGWNNAQESMSKIIPSLETIFTNIKNSWKTVISAVHNLFKGLANWFNERVIIPIAQYFASLIKPIIENFQNIWNNITELWGKSSGWFSENVIEPILSVFIPLTQKIGEIFSTIWQIITSVFGYIATWTNENVIQPTIGFFMGLYEGATGAINLIWSMFTSVLGFMADWTNQNVIMPIMSFFNNLFNSIANGITGVWNWIVNIFGRIAGWINNNVVQPVKNAFIGAWEAVGNAISGIIRGAINGALYGIERTINNFIYGLNSVVDIVNKIPGVSIGRINPLYLPRFANGGFPSTGEFFLARESGPEMVGRIGNKTTVANNDQIVSGIQQGVYNAMINAQVGQTSSGTNVYIGNRQVYRSFSNGLKTENNRLGTSAVRV